ncbi:MAG: beta-lactamase family protein [Gammaproteobacteria bacterium]|nr:beta-lactamase family protein [Gammaproteobacteria bacterium]
MLRFLKRIALGLLALIALALLGAFIAKPVMTTRLLGLPFGGSQGPTDLVRGGPVPALVIASEAERTLSPDLIAQAIQTGAEIDAYSLLIWQGGALQLEHYYGEHDAQSIAPTQSMHKSVLAMLVGIAIEQGLIGSVDDPAANYIEEWAGDERRHITIRQMLQQASGIDFPAFPAVIDMTIGDRLAQITFEQGVLAPPGTQFDYTNINPEVLGILLERVSGSSYADYLSESLWRHVSDDDATVLLDTETTRTPRTFCCLDSTARAWLRIGLLHLNHGRVGDRQIVPEQWMKDIVTPSALNPNYGYLTWLGTTYQKERRYNRKSAAAAFHSEPFAAPDVIYFDGFGGQRVYIVPSKQLVIVTTGPLRQDWDDALLPNLVIRGMGG